MTMQVGLLLPSAPVDEWRLDQRLQGILERFGADVQIVFLRADAIAPNAPAINEPLEHLSRVDLQSLGARVHFAEEQLEFASDASWFSVAATGRIIPSKPERVDASEFPSLDSHAFSRYGLQGWQENDFYCFHYFPYGYLFRLLGLGKIDEFGHRISVELRKIRERPREEKLVVCFGGSAVWGISVLPDQSFPSQLENLMKGIAPHLNVRVLNFGIPGAVILNQTQRFMLLAADLKPDILIAHDGVNDFFYSATSDPYLLTHHSIVYQQNLENWARALHWRTPSIENVNMGGRPTTAPNEVLPITTVRAYARRKREFVKVAKAFGTKVISGLQPLATDKASLSRVEASRIARWLGSPPAYSSEFDLVRGAMQLIQTNGVAFGADVELHLTDAFRNLDARQTHFADLVHADVLGEQVIAEAYLPHVIKLLEDGDDAGR